MLRKIIFSPNEYYHIYNRGVDKRVIFLDDDDRRRFVDLLYLANSDSSYNYSDIVRSKGRICYKEIERPNLLVNIGAWCLMPNHFHLLLKERDLLEDGPQVKSGISIFMKKLLTGYSMYMNKKYQRRGALFEGNFGAKHLDSDEYLKYQYAYIHLNPIGIIDKGWKEKKISDKAKAEKFLTTYKYSSYHDYSGTTRDEELILEKKAFPEYFINLTDFSDMIDEWINFEAVARLPLDK